jgi:hypothetical protein
MQVDDDETPEESNDILDDETGPLVPLHDPDLTWTVSHYAKDEVVLALVTALLQRQVADCFAWAHELIASGYTALFPLLRHIYYDFYYELNPSLEAYLDKKEKEADTVTAVLTVLKNMLRATATSTVFLWRQMTYNEAVLLDYDLNRLSLGNSTTTTTSTGDDNDSQSQMLLLLTHVVQQDWLSLCYELRWLFEHDLGLEAQTAVWDFYAGNPQRNTVSAAVLQQHHTFIQILLVIARCEATLPDKKLRFVTYDGAHSAATPMMPLLQPELAAFALSQDATPADTPQPREAKLLPVDPTITWRHWLERVFPYSYDTNTPLEPSFKFRF